MDHDLRALGIDLVDLVGGRAPAGVTPRRVLWLISQLPDSSAFNASQRGGGDQRRWTTDIVLLAQILNFLMFANYQRGGGKGRKPTPVDPPAPRRHTGRHSKVGAHIARGIAAQESVSESE